MPRTASGEIPTPLSPPRASPLSFRRIRPYLGCGFSFMNSALQKEPGNGGDNYRQTNQNAKDFKNEATDSIGDEESSNAENDQQNERGKRQIAGFDLVENALHVVNKPLSKFHPVHSIPGFRANSAWAFSMSSLIRCASPLVWP